MRPFLFASMLSAPQPEYRDMSIKIEEGKVYLRDERNGNVHPYEELLAQMDYMKPFIGGKETVDEPKSELRVNLSGLERAAEYDKLVGMTPEERKEYLGGRLAPWERPDYLSNADAVPPPPGAPAARKPVVNVASQPQQPAQTPPPAATLATTDAAPAGAQAVSAADVPTRETSLNPGVETSLTPNAVTSNESVADVTAQVVEANNLRAADVAAVAQAAEAAPPTNGTQKRYRLGDKATSKGYTLDALRAQGWTNEQLIAEEYLVEVPQDNG